MSTPVPFDRTPSGNTTVGQPPKPAPASAALRSVVVASTLVAGGGGGGGIADALARARVCVFLLLLLLFLENSDTLQARIDVHEIRGRLAVLAFDAIVFDARGRGGRGASRVAGGTRPAGCVRHLGRRVPKVIQRALFAARLTRNVRPGAVGTGLADVRGFGGRILRELAGFAGFAVAVLIPGNVVPPRNAVRARACRIYVFLPGGAGFAGAVCCTLRERVEAGITRLARTSRIGVVMSFLARRAILVAVVGACGARGSSASRARAHFWSA